MNFADPTKHRKRCIGLHSRMSRATSTQILMWQRPPGELREPMDHQGGRSKSNRRYEKDDDTHPWELEDEEASQHASSIGWVKRNKPLVHMLDSSSLDGDYMVIALRHKRFTELKVAGAQLPIRTNGKASRVWIDSGSPISIFTIGELRRNLRD